MPDRTYTEQTRQQITRSSLNRSTSKHLFQEYKPNCPQVSYNINLSTISNKKSLFGTARRKIFTQCSQAPTSWNYNPKAFNKNATITIGQGRQNVAYGDYMNRQLFKNPGPGRYQKEHPIQGKGYTLRPKTANQRNYFIEDKEHQSIPGPGTYQTNSKIVGKNSVSKYKTSTTGLMSKSNRFSTFCVDNPSAFTYKLKRKDYWKKGAKIGKCDRKSFIDQAVKNSNPGPGRYKLPTQFGHYKNIKQIIHTFKD